MGMFGNAVRRVLTEDFENGKFVVYHGTRSSAESGIADKGFERFFTSSNGGNMYGAGVYTTYKLSTSGQNARGVYGQIMYKARVKSLNGFVIYDPEVAKKVYGKNWMVKDQLNLILSPEEIHRMKTEGYYSFDKMVNSRQDSYTAPCALDMCQYFSHYDVKAGYKVNGYIFSGNHDGWVCFIKDFKNVIPFEISRDCGRTWEPFKAMDNFYEFAVDDVDLKFQLGKHNFELMNSLKEVPYFFIGGFARVEDNSGKFNFLYRKKPLKQGVISPVWFDAAPRTFSDKGEATVSVGNKSYILKLNPKDNTFKVYNSEGRYLCSLNEFKTYLGMKERSFTEDDFSDEDF